MRLHCALFWMFFAGAGWAAQPSAQEIVNRSSAAMNADWKAAPNYAFTERDVQVKRGGKTTKTYQVMMIGGSPYNKLTMVNDKPISSQQQQAEEAKLKKEMARRGHESANEHAKRVAKYERERQQDNAMMREMTVGFQFAMGGEETVNGHPCWVLKATPKPGYVPKSRDTKVLTGMRGTLWVDQAAYQWVKVEAEVFQPVSFGGFLAKVSPGTRFELEQEPVNGNLWLPHHFSMKVNASVLWRSQNSTDDETYTHYEPAVSVR